MDQLKYYQGKIVVAYDNDRAGNDGLRAFDLRRRRTRMKPISYCFPVKGFKDWNEMFVKQPQLTLETLQSHREFNLNEWDTMRELDTLDQ
jgi:DNA primase